MITGTGVSYDDNGEIISSINQSVIHKAECLRVLDEIIDGLDEKALLEIMQGNGSDIDTMIDGMLRDVLSILVIRI